jgi:hypothetical protein
VSEPGKVTALTLPQGAPAQQMITISAHVMEEGLRKAEAKGRRDERASAKSALDALLEAHARELDTRDADLKRLAEDVAHRERAAYAHGFHKAVWMGGAGGFIVAASVVIILALILLAAGSESTVRGAAAGSMIRAQEELREDVRRFGRGETGRDTPRLTPPEEDE